MRVLLCDDDVTVLELRQKIDIMLKSMVPEENVWISTFNNVFELNDYLEKEKLIVDVIFMDIMLSKDGKVNGIEEAKKIKANHPEINIIFCTGNIAYAEDVYDVDPLYFLVKPVNEEKLQKALKKLIKTLKKDKYLTVRLVGEIRRINLSTIFYAESQRKYVKIYTEEGCFSTLTKLDNIEEQLDHNFERCHKSYIININKIKAFQYTSIKLVNDVEVPISRQYRSLLKERLVENI